MMPAQYAVIRIVADPARDEPMNVGIVLWRDAEVRLRIDSEALSTVVKRHRHLASDALSFVEEYLRSGLSDVDNETAERVPQVLLELSRFPVSITEPRFVALTGGTLDELEAEIERIVGRVVQPPKSRGGGRPSVRQELRKQLKSLVQHKLLAVDHVFRSSRSGNPWSVDFYANSGTSLAIDALSLAVRDADEIARRAAAEAFKVYDILAPESMHFVVHCDLIDDERFHEANQRARRCLETVGVEVSTELDDLVLQLRSQFAPQMFEVDLGRAQHPSWAENKASHDSR